MIAKNIRRMNPQELVATWNRFADPSKHVAKITGSPEEFAKKLEELLVATPDDKLSTDEANVLLSTTPDHPDVLAIQARLSGLFPIGLSNVRDVYSGKAGKCCCGCSGKYFYASQHRESGGRERGYPVTDDEISDRMIQKVTRMINEVFTSIINGTDSLVDGVIDCMDEGFASIRVGSRLYIAYWND